MKKIILIADDERMMRKLNSMIVERNFPDCSVELFKDGKELEERLNQNLEGVRVVITDNNMPFITGLEIIKKYASKIKDIPFILNYGGHERFGKEAVENGAYCYVQKGNKLSDPLKEIL